jgi:hypothetical protein
MDVMAAITLLALLGLVALIAGVESRQGFEPDRFPEDLS